MCGCTGSLFHNDAPFAIQESKDRYVVTLLQLCDKLHVDLKLHIQQHGMVELSGVLKGGEVKRAMECCVALSQWDQAVALAQQYSIPQVQSLLFKYAAMLLDQHTPPAAGPLNRMVTLTPPAPPPSSFPQHPILHFPPTNPSLTPSLSTLPP